MGMHILLSISLCALLARAQYNFVGCIATGTIGSRLPLLGEQVTIGTMDVNYCFQVCSFPTVNTIYAAVYNGYVANFLGGLRY